MRTILRIAAAAALFGIAGYAWAEPASQGHAGHDHSAAPAATPTPAPGATPSPSPDAKGCGHMMPSGAPMAGMGGMQGMTGPDGKPTEHKHMMGGNMNGCDNMMQGGAMPMAPASPTPSPKP